MILGFDLIPIIDSRYSTILLFWLFNGQIHKMNNYALAFWQQEDHELAVAIPFWM